MQTQYQQPVPGEGYGPGPGNVAPYPVDPYAQSMPLPQRLNVLVRYGEGPHMTAFAILPLGLALAWIGLRAGKTRWLAAAAAVPLLLITLLVLFIAALGEGLANGNRQYIANLDAQLIVFLEKSDYLIESSRLDANTVRAVRRVEGVSDAGPIYTSTSEIVSLEEPLKISMLAVEPDMPGMPPLIEGRPFRGGEASEAVIDEGVALRSGIQVGDEIQIRSTQGTQDEHFTLKVVGLVQTLRTPNSLSELKLNSNLRMQSL